jgi:hypothetical protein
VDFVQTVQASSNVFGVNNGRLAEVGGMYAASGRVTPSKTTAGAELCGILQRDCVGVSVHEYNIRYSAIPRSVDRIIVMLEKNALGKRL